MYIKLSRLVEEAEQVFGTESSEKGSYFLNQLKKELEESERPRFSHWAFTFSLLSGGLLPLFYAILSLIQVYQIQKKCHQLNQFSVEDSNRLNALGLSILRMTDGVTFDGRQLVINQMKAPTFSR